jgi:hypothetical protein
MNTDKLVKAIQIIVEEEVTRRVPKLVKEGVKKEMAKLLKENKQLREALKPKQEVQTPSMAQAIFEDELPTQQPQKPFSKNPVLNEVLSQTVGFNSSNIQGGGVESLRAQMAQQMGYGDMTQGAQPTGIGIDTGNEVVNKALNRDYSQLMKALDKKKGPFRPGM